MNSTTFKREQNDSAANLEVIVKITLSGGEERNIVFKLLHSNIYEEKVLLPNI